MAGPRVFPQFRRKPEKATILGRLDATRAGLLARHARAARKEISFWRGVLRNPEKPVFLDGKFVKLHNVDPQVLRGRLKPGADLTHRQPRKKALWVVVSPGGSSDDLPELHEISELKSAPLTRWALFLRKYGLVEFKREWVVAVLEDRREYLLRVPITALQETAVKALVLIAAEKAVQGSPDEFRSLLENFTAQQAFLSQFERNALQPSLWTSMRRPRWKVNPNEPVEEARRIIALALEEALEQVEPIVEPGSHGIPERWAFYARGCWPLVVLFEFMRMRGYVQPKSQTCKARACSNPVPPHQTAYCSEVCRWREKQRRRRKRQREKIAEAKQPTYVPTIAEIAHPLSQRRRG